MEENNKETKSNDESKRNDESENTIILILNMLLSYFEEKNTDSFLFSKKEIEAKINEIISDNNFFNDEIFNHISSFILTIDDNINISELTLFIHNYIENINSK